jgi:predicted RNA-binding protein YlxR (DUF448 family)
VVRRPEGEAAYDETGKANGRGAYVCASTDCIALAKKQKKLDKSLKAVVGPDVFDSLLSAAAKAGA